MPGIRNELLLLLRRSHESDKYLIESEWDIVQVQEEYFCSIVTPVFVSVNGRMDDQSKCNRYVTGD